MDLCSGVYNTSILLYFRFVIFNLGTYGMSKLVFNINIYYYCLWIFRVTYSNPRLTFPLLYAGFLNMVLP